MMHTVNGDINWEIDDGYLTFFTEYGDIMIPYEELENLHEAIGKVMNDE